MRLRDFEIQTINLLAKKYFDKNVQVFLFGSRVTDTKRGGDIDLFIKCDRDDAMTIKTKILFLVELKKIIGERKIDVVFDNGSTRSKQNFYHTIIHGMIPLNSEGKC